MMWFALYVNLVTSCLACVLHAHVHGAHAPKIYGMSKYPSDLACMQMQTDLNLGKITAFIFSGTKCPKCKQDMIPILYLNENFMDCDTILTKTAIAPCYCQMKA